MRTPHAPHPADPRDTRTTCPYCGVGCGVIVRTQGAEIVDVRGDPEHPANRGRLCSKGASLHLTATQALTRQTRLLAPALRPQRGAPAQPIAWDEALGLAARRIADVVTRHGPDAIGLYVSGQLLTEDYYVFNKLAKGLIGTNNIDSNSRLCMSSAVAGYKQALGADAPPACYDDIDRAGCILFAGSNAAYAHPVLFQRVLAAKAARPELRLIVIDPRRTDTAGAADLFLPIRPGTDVALFHGMLNVMLWEGWIDRPFIDRHTSGFEALRDRVREYTPEHVAGLCGIPRDDLVLAARWFATTPATLSLYCQGLNQSSSGTDKNVALINLHLAAGQIGRAGAGPLSLTGQPNAMGGREVGAMANLLSAHRDPDSAADRAELAALWRVPALPDRPGLTAVDLFRAAADGKIKLLWIVCTNPAQSLPDQAMVRQALDRAEWVIVQDAFATTATGRHADLLLPASTWGEKEGTVTNSERRISRVRAAIPAPGLARPDWAIGVEVARRLEPLLSDRPCGLFPYRSPEEIWCEHRGTTQGRDLDIGGLDYRRLEQAPQQWPFPAGAQDGLSRLYTDGRFATADGRARFVACAYRPPAEPTDARYPLALNTGRLRDQWHGMSRTGTIGRLFGHAPEPAVSLHPEDARVRGLADGDLVYLTSRRGSIVLPMASSRELGPGQAYLPMHWGGEFLGGSGGDGRQAAGVNALTNPVCCPTSKQPELKHSAVKVLKADLPWTLLALAWLPADSAWTALLALRECMPAFSYATCLPFGRERSGVLMKAAAHAPPPPAVLDRIELLLGLQDRHSLRYSDARRGLRRVARIDATDDRLAAVLLAGDTDSGAWIQALLQDGHPVGELRRQLLRPGARAPAPVGAAASRQVCSCVGVSEQAIQAELRACEGTDGARLQRLQTRLGCGTQCGSCVPELRRLIGMRPAQPALAA